MAIAGRKHKFLFRWEKCCWHGSSKRKKDTIIQEKVATLEKE